MTKEDLLEKLDLAKSLSDRDEFSVDVSLLESMLEEIDRLNRIMPHTGQTCKLNDADTGECLVKETTDPHWECQPEWYCPNDKWELKD